MMMILHFSAEWQATFDTSLYSQPLKDKYPNFEVGLKIKCIIIVF